MGGITNSAVSAQIERQLESIIKVHGQKIRDVSFGDKNITPSGVLSNGTSVTDKLGQAQDIFIGQLAQGYRARAEKLQTDILENSKFKKHFSALHKVHVEIDTTRTKLEKVVQKNVTVQASHPLVSRLKDLVKEAEKLQKKIEVTQVPLKVLEKEFQAEAFALGDELTRNHFLNRADAILKS